MTNATEIQDLAGLLRPRSDGTSIVPQTDAEWERVVAVAIDNGLCGLLLEGFRNSGLSVPERFESRLAGGAQCVASKNAALGRESESVLCELNDASIPALLLKGVALNRTVYNRPELRPMSDLDVLVHPENATRALSVLVAGPCRRGAELVQEDFFPRFHYEAELWTRSEQPARIDLHARPFRPLRYARIVPDDGMWHDATLVQVGTARAWVPSLERMFVHLAAHAAFHGCSRIVWLYDLIRWCDRYRDTLDWSKVIECCRAWKLSAAAGMAMRRAAELFGPAWPKGVEKELIRVSPGWRDRLVLRQAPKDAASPLRHVVCNVLTTPGLCFKLGYLRAVLLPNGAHLSATYAGRHAGWRLVALGRRIIKAVARGLRLPVFAESVKAQA